MDIVEMRKTQQGQVYFYHVPTGSSTWHDPRIPRDLPANELANELGPLPMGNATDPKWSCLFCRS